MLIAVTSTLVSRSRAPNSFFPVGTTPVTYTFTDPSGNTVTVTFDVTVLEVDTSPPVITQPNDDVIIVTAPFGSPGTTVNWIEPTATDNSGTATLVSRSRAPNSFFPVGTTPVTYTFTDPSGNTVTVTFDVTVLEVDGVAPVVSQPEDITVTVPLGTLGTTINWDEPTATDNSGTVTLASRSRAPNSFFNVGTTPVTYTFTDPSGNTASVTFDVNVLEVDAVAPVVSQPEDVTVTVPLGTLGTTINWDEPTATDNSGTATLVSRSRAPNSFFPVGTTPVTYTFTDPSGNTASVTFDVNVIEVDTVAPVISQPEDITVTVPLGTPGRTVNWDEPTATDNSGTVTLASRSRAPNSFFNVGTTPVTYTFTDPSGNTASVTFDVNVLEVDTVAPVISQPEDITVTVPLGTPGRTVNWDEPSATDNSGTVTLASRSRAPNSFFNIGTTPVTYTFTDPSGNTASVTFNVNVIEVDTVAPVISQPEDVTVTVPLGTLGTTINWDEPTATDNSGTVTLASRSRAPNSFFNVGTTPVTYTFTDPSGNTASVTFNVNVLEVDTVAPVISQPEDITVTVPLGTLGTTINWDEPTATDNSGTVTLASRSRAPNSFFNVGTTPVTYTFTDPSGNTASVTFNVNVLEVDTVAPVISQPEDITVTVPLGTLGTTINWDEPSATDNSGTVTLVSRSRAPNSFFNVGTTPVTYTFTDPSGNTASISFDVNVLEVDTVAPVISQPEDITVTVPLGTPGRTVNWDEPTATDNSGTVTLASRSRAPNSFFNVGTTPVTYTFTDPSGNTASVTFDVNVLEVDSVPPVIPQPDDITVTVPLGSTGIVITWDEPIPTDNSGTVSLVSRTSAPNTLFPVGTTPVTYTFTDPSGNTASVTFDVNVIEGILYVHKT
ncbi:hyalin-like [Amphiura filiformis]|uniref:hyalin-like n=1 Tax=Amphiura filiformis TaxID=82378 RepID=UPI003B21C4E9